MAHKLKILEEMVVGANSGGGGTGQQKGQAAGRIGAGLRRYGSADNGDLKDIKSLKVDDSTTTGLEGDFKLQ